ncbi:calmodulin-binding protein [Actinomadura rayongensis]|uniref:Calmodulin-binding protein n=1 Tax=Actinomadura rayongensis TaxID=1429076 RepID=A0A6I4VXQ0_9ACTN|nr:calmodulin-binding protein [Actinomadura rayongensis]MXQ63159.1 calmodulin-binding protein [Actinomadura rayongensis]
MRHMITKLGALGALAALAVTGAPAAQAAQHRAEGVAYFEFTDHTRETGVVELTDPGQIAHARALLAGETTDQPHLMGRIVKRSTPYNPRWSFHYDPATVRFFNVAIEVCDAPMPYVEDHLDEAGGAFLPGAFWCPWTSRLVKEVTPRA